ncbi:MAG: hypothetical protein QOF55_672, partial [Thermoleophilaceae bacterium]|nr:hypothetical protein [Thermoleophilaceae bacterium]
MRRLAVAVLVLSAVLAAPAAAFDPGYEARNFSKTNERAAIYNTPEYRALLTQVSAQNLADALQMQAADSERQFAGQDLCWNWGDGCAGDARLYDWGPKGYGIVQPVLFTARDGATLSGRVWATRAGPAKRPGVVITDGSVQAPETLYWFAAQTLAKAGYVVLTYDPQGQGRSDQHGEGADSNEGFPAQSDGRPFFDGTQDALDFFLSTPSAKFEPRASCSTGTSHAAKQDRRVAEGRNAAFNPYWAMVDPSRVGLAGHSYGAAGVSYIGQKDPRVKTVVAWDALKKPTADMEQPCPADPSARTPAAITKPALNMSADYFIPPTPNTSDPDPAAKSAVSRNDYSGAGVDTGSLVIRGGTHYDFDWIPNFGFGATLRGADMITWYTTAWFDAYLKGDPTASARLRTNRWRADAPEAKVDPDGDGNMFSRYYRSRMDIGRAGGTRFECEDMRTGCPGLAADDGQPATYDYLSIVTRPDGVGAAGAGGGSGTACVASAAVRGARAVPRGRRVRFSAPGRLTVEVFRHTTGRRVTRQRLVARFARRSGAFTWNGRANRPGRRVRDGVYAVRFRAPNGAVGHLPLVRRGGRFTGHRGYRIPAGCATLRSATLARPAFGGATRRALDVWFRLNTPARVSVVIRRGGKVIRRFAARDRTAGPTFRL